MRQVEVVDCLASAPIALSPIHLTEGNNMLYKLCYDTARPGKTYEYLARFKQSLDGLASKDKLKGCWTTDDYTAYSGFGKLNQVVHIWEIDEREAQALSSPASNNKQWPPQPDDILVERSFVVLTPAPFMKAMEPQATWSMYELAIDTVEPGCMPKVLEAWGPGIDDRVAQGPLAGCWTAEAGGLSRIFHLWGCPGLRNRERIRNRSFKEGAWPPARQYLVSQENCLLIPAVFAAEKVNEEYLARDLATSSPTYVPGPSSNIPTRQATTA